MLVSLLEHHTQYQTMAIINDLLHSPSYALLNLRKQTPLLLFIRAPHHCMYVPTKHKEFQSHPEFLTFEIPFWDRVSLHTLAGSELKRSTCLCPECRMKGVCHHIRPEIPSNLSPHLRFPYLKRSNLCFQLFITAIFFVFSSKRNLTQMPWHKAQGFDDDTNNCFLCSPQQRPTWLVFLEFLQINGTCISCRSLRSQSCSISASSIHLSAGTKHFPGCQFASSAHAHKHIHSSCYTIRLMQ